MPFIQATIAGVCGDNLSDHIFCDLFAGTGAVGKAFKSKVEAVIANDLEFYSYVLNKNYIENSNHLDTEKYFQVLNELSGEKGFIFQEYGENGSSGRLYFNQKNAQKIDAIRQHIESWKTQKIINIRLYYHLLASLLESSDKVANTASVYGAYLKKIKPSAQKELMLKPAFFETSLGSHKVYNDNSNHLIKKIEGDILYLDPPYNARQYGANYHLLNTIAKYNIFVPKGKTGLPIYNKSTYCSVNYVLQSLDELLENAQFKYIFLSYNNEGLLSSDMIRTLMERYGKYDLTTKIHQRFKADKTQNRNHKATSTTEQIHILEKR